MKRPDLLDLVVFAPILLAVVLGFVEGCSNQSQETPQAVERKIGTTGYALRGSIVTQDTFVEFRHLEPDAIYWFTVKAFCEDGTMSGPSDTVFIYIDPNGKGHVLKGNPLDHEEDDDA